MDKIVNFLKENKILTVIVILVILGIIVYLLLRTLKVNTSYINEADTRTKEIQTDVLTGKPTNQ